MGGFFCEMLGTSGPLVAQSTRKANTYWDSILKQALELSVQEHKIVPFLKSAGNDEKVLDSPGVDIPTVSLTRSPYKEYHSSEDNYDLINEKYLHDARDVVQTFFDLMEEDYVPSMNQPGPIFLSGHDLYPNWEKDPSELPRWLSFLDIMYAIDGERSLLEIAHDTKHSYANVKYWCDAFASKNLITKRKHILGLRHSSKHQ